MIYPPLFWMGGNVFWGAKQENGDKHTGQKAMRILPSQFLIAIYRDSSSKYNTLAHPQYLNFVMVSHKDIFIIKSYVVFPKWLSYIKKGLVLLNSLLSHSHDSRTTNVWVGQMCWSCIFWIDGEATTVKTGQPIHLNWTNIKTHGRITGPEGSLGIF